MALAGQGQRAAHRPQFAAQRQLAGELVAGDVVALDLPRRLQDADGDGQIEPFGVLLTVKKKISHTNQRLNITNTFDCQFEQFYLYHDSLGELHYP